MSATDRFVVISGCSGGGKSTLVEELARRGFAVVREAGRRLLHEARAHGGTALPWADPDAFLHRILAMSLADHAAAGMTKGWVFFDRSVVDALSGLEARSGEHWVARAAASLSRAGLSRPALARHLRPG